MHVNSHLGHVGLMKGSFATALFLAILIVSTMLLAPQAIAQGQTQGAPAQNDAQERATLNDSVREAERDGGRVLRAESIRRDGSEVHRMKVMTPDGRVRVLRENSNDKRDKSDKQDTKDHND